MIVSDALLKISQNLNLLQDTRKLLLRPHIKTFPLKPPPPLQNHHHQKHSNPNSGTTPLHFLNFHPFDQLVKTPTPPKIPSKNHTRLLTYDPFQKDLRPLSKRFTTPSSYSTSNPLLVYKNKNTPFKLCNLFY